MAASALGHPGRERVREQDRRAQVHVERPVDLLLAEAGHGAARRKRRVRHERVERPGPLQQRRQGVPVGEVGAHHRGVAAELRAQLLERVGAPAAQDHARAALGERPGDRLSDPAAGAREEDVAAGQLHRAGPYLTARPAIQRGGPWPAEPSRSAACARSARPARPPPRAADRRKRRVILLVASAVAALAVVGILIAVSQSGGDDESGLGGGESIAGVRDVAQRFRGIPQDGATPGRPGRARHDDRVRRPPVPLLRRVHARLAAHA